MKGLFAGAVAVAVFVLMLDSQIQGGDKTKAAEKITIKQVMKKAMGKGGLCGKVAGGTADDDEKKELIKLFTALTKATPPKGEEDSWKEKTKALLDAAKADDGAALKKAANCPACHNAHKK